ncbi:MAG TPA: hypothetical protein VK191_03735 [Symbiobacteriaceae bacterium]|nr:hypothetical protein [Symbiobacteriaceae bacterium]
MPRSSTTLQVGDLAPDFTLDDQGAPWRLSAHLPIALIFNRSVY